MVDTTDIILLTAAAVFFAGLVAGLALVYRRQVARLSRQNTSYRRSRRLFAAGCVLTFLAFETLAAEVILGFTVPTAAGVGLVLAALLPLGVGLVRVFDPAGLGE